MGDPPQLVAGSINKASRFTGPGHGSFLLILRNRD